MRKTCPTLRPACFAALTLLLAATPAARAAVTVVNGDFQNTTGLSDLGGGWYGGVPAGWIGNNANYSVGTSSGSDRTANLEWAANTEGSFVPLWQTIGTVDAESTVTLTFTVLQPWTAGTSQAGAAIWSDNTFTGILASQSDLANGTHTLTAEHVPAGTALTIGFWRSQQGNSPGLDNVTVTVTPVPEASATVLLSLLIPVAAFARRRR